MSAAQQQTPRLRLHTLTSSAGDAEIQRILDLSNTIFEHDPIAAPTIHSSFAHWRDRLSDPKSAIFYVIEEEQEKATPSSVSSPSPEGPSRAAPLGFFFNFTRTHPELGFETMHIWLAGVDPAARGLGIFPRLVERSREQARATGIEYLSVGTIPSRFTKMYRILGENGWELVAWRCGEAGAEGAHVLMKLKA